MTRHSKRCVVVETEVYSRVVGYYRPVKNWNNGKAREFMDRRLMQAPQKTVVICPSPSTVIIEMNGKNHFFTQKRSFEKSRKILEHVREILEK